MFGISDAHHFRKMVAGFCMLFAPICLLIGFIVDPDASYAFLFVGAILMVPAALGLMHMLREREVAAGHLGGALALVGTMAAIGSTAIGMVMWQMTATADMAALVKRVQDTTGTAVLFYGAVFCLTAGMLVLCLGMWRAHAAHHMAIGLVAIGSVAAAVGFAASVAWPLVAGYAALMLGLGAIGHMVLNETVEDWEHTPAIAAS